MKQYFDVFIKSIITALAILFVAGVWYDVRILLTVDERLTKIEQTLKENSDKTNMLYYKYIEKVPNF